MLSLFLVNPALAQGPVLPQHSDPTWSASYWNNAALSGTPVVTREDANINFDWGTGSPHADIASDQFSARWTRYIDVTPGTYTFSATSDDGMRIWIDNVLVLDAWYDHPPQTFTFDRYMGTGHHLIKVEYYENGGLAVAKLAWRGQTAPPGDWEAEYFNNMTLSGPPALVRQETAVHHDWGASSPAPGTINADHFSARWTLTRDIAAGMTNFQLTTDDGARLWVNGHLLIDAWYDQAATTYTGDIFLPGGSTTIELQYYENGGLAVAKLSWDGEDGEPTPPPSGTVIVDDTDAGFVKGGPASGWRYEQEGYNDRLTWTYNNYSAGYYYNWARWYPDLQARRYEVFVYVPYRFTTTAHARYWVRHAHGYSLRVVDQSAQGDRWVSLGTYTFTGTSNDYVSLADVTFEPYRSRLIGFDAVKWEPR
jgi:hypothetical protein